MHSLQMRKPVGRSHQEIWESVLNFGGFLNLKKLEAIPDLQYLAFLYL